MRVLIGFIFALSVSFACDQPYEEVGGYKIGCPFVVTDEYTLSSELPELNAKEYKKEIDGIFDAVTIMTVNGNIEQIEFERNENRSFTESDVKDLLSSLGDRWGEMDNSKYGGRIYTVTPKNDIVGMVSFFSSSIDDSNIFALRYNSKKLLEIYEKAQQSKEDQRKNELSTY